METVVFTNGCFDILHPGHLDLLEKAKKLGTKLIVGINSDDSVRAIKGSPRPFVSQNDRAEMLLGLRSVDEVMIFDEPTPQQIIEKIKPDVLIKGGDWAVDQIIGADFVVKNGGRVFSIPLKEGYSTTAIVEKVSSKFEVQSSKAKASSVENGLVEHLEIFRNLLDNDISAIEKCGNIIVESIKRGDKIMLCTDDESAGDAHHLAAELNKQCERNRQRTQAIALTADAYASNAIGSNYDLGGNFARQVEAQASEGDVLVGISTSGNSPSVISAVMHGRAKKCLTIGLTGAKGKKLASLCDASILVPSDRISRIREAHIIIGRLWCEMVAAEF